MSATLYTREGRAVSAFHADEAGKPYTVERVSCGRCGGAGGSDAWKFTGWTCYDCGGKGDRGTRAVKLYTAEKLAKLDAPKANATAKRAAKAKAAADQAQAAADVKREAFMAEHGALMLRAEAFVAALPEDRRDGFVADVYAKAQRWNQLSEKQAAALAAALDKADASAAAKGASQYVGKVGERLTLDVTVERSTSFYRPSFRGYGDERVHVVAMRDAAGNAIVSMSPSFSADQGEKLTVKATVKEHAEYRGEKQTKVNRVAAR